MKIIALFLLISISGFSQEKAMKGYLGNQVFDCISKSDTVNKKIIFDGKSNCTHRYINADYSDVNEEARVVYSVYCVCGCPDYTNYARVCEICKRNERWTIKKWNKPVEQVKSKYKIITEN